MRDRVPIKDAKVTIVGLARNCEDVIGSELRRIDSAFAQFKARNWIVVESDSDDGTADEIRSIASTMDLQLISHGRLRDRHPRRTHRLAVCRNTYLELIESDSEAGRCDFVVVVDLDGVNDALTPASIRACWDAEVDWDACFANQSGPYYDMWALRHSAWSPGDWHENYDLLLEHGVRQHKAIEVACFGRMVTLDPDAPPLEVDSAFGGLGIYKRRLFDGARYVGAGESGRELCEHVALHESMRRKGARLFIIPSCINGTWNEHSDKVRPFPRFVRSFKACLVDGLALLGVSPANTKR